MTILSSDLLDPPPVYSVAIAATGTTSVIAGGVGDASFTFLGTLGGPTSTQRGNARLPMDVLLRVFSLLTAASLEEQMRAQGRVWMMSEGRCVCKVWYLACMSLLRGHYLPSYRARVIPPYSSHAWSLHPSVSTSTLTPPYRRRAPPTHPQPPTPTHTSDPIATRETRVLDLYIASSARRQLDALESSLFSSDDVSYQLEEDVASTRDDGALFDLWQPRSRLEDLLIYSGLRRGVFRCRYAKNRTSRHSGIVGGDEKDRRRETSREDGGSVRAQDEDEIVVVAEDVSVHFTLREICLHLPFRGSGTGTGDRGRGDGIDSGGALSTPVAIIRRPVLELPRQRSDTLEVSARRILEQLAQQPLPIKRIEMARGSQQQTWYEEVAVENEDEEQGRTRRGDQEGESRSRTAGSGGGGGSVRNRLASWLKK